MKIEIEVSDDNEGSNTPYWLILDPRQNMDCDIHALAGQIVGPFFSREEAEAQLTATRYNYSKRAKVYCHSGCYSRQYYKKIKEAAQAARL